MNTIKIILIVGCVYISLVQKKNSTRNMMLLLTGLLAFCMLGITEGYCTLPISLQDPSRQPSCIKVLTADQTVVGDGTGCTPAAGTTCTLDAAGDAPTSSCVYVDAGPLATSANDNLTGIISHFAKCASGGEATLNAAGSAKCISDAGATNVDQSADLVCADAATPPPPPPPPAHAAGAAAYYPCTGNLQTSGAATGGTVASFCAGMTNKIVNVGSYYQGASAVTATQTNLQEACCVSAPTPSAGGTQATTCPDSPTCGSHEGSSWMVNSDQTSRYFTGTPAIENESFRHNCCKRSYENTELDPLGTGCMVMDSDKYDHYSGLCPDGTPATDSNCLASQGWVYSLGGDGLWHGEVCVPRD